MPNSLAPVGVTCAGWRMFCGFKHFGHGRSSLREPNMSQRTGMSAVTGGAPASAAQTAASAVAEAGAEAPSWASSMEGIRRAHLAEADALEKIVSALASKQQSSISELRRQVEAIAARQSKGYPIDRARANREKPKVADAPLVESRTVADVPDGVMEQPTSTESAITHTIGDVGEGGEEDETVLEETFEEWEGPFEEEVHPPPAEDLVYLVHRVAHLEKDMLKLQGMWDMNKGQRVIEVWMGLLNKKSYKPSQYENPEDCAVITLQNWWRDMLVTRLGWSSSSETGSVSDGEETEAEKDQEQGLDRHETRSSSPSNELALPIPELNVEPTRQSKTQLDKEDSLTPVALATGFSNVEQARKAGGQEVPYAEVKSRLPHDMEGGGEIVGPVHSGGGVARDASNVESTGTTEQSPQRRQDDEEGVHPKDRRRRIPTDDRNDGNGEYRRGEEKGAGGGPRAVIDDSREFTEKEMQSVEEQATNRKGDSNETPRGVSSLDESAWPVQDARETSTERTTSPAKNRVRHRPRTSTPPSSRQRKRPSGTSSKQSTPGSPGNRKPHAGGHHHSESVHRHGEGGHRHHGSGGHPHHEGGPEGGGVQGLFDGAIGGSPVLMITSMAMQLQSLETEVGNLRQHMEDIDDSISLHSKKEEENQQQGILRERQQSAQTPQVQLDSNARQEGCQKQRDSDEGAVDDELTKMDRHVGQLQWELRAVRDREEDRERRTDLSLEAIEALIVSKEEDADRRFRQQAEENADQINELLKKFAAQGPEDKSETVRRPLVELKLELRSLQSSLSAIAGNEVSASVLRTLEGIRHLLASLAERARELEEEIGDPAQLARCIVADDVVARRFADLATSLGTTLFAFIKAQVLQTRRARDGKWSGTSSHRHSSDADSASAVIAAKMAGGGSSSGSGGGGSGGENDDSGQAGTSATPQAWAKLSSLSYRRERTNENLPFPAGLVGLLKAITDVLDHCVGTGDLAIRLSVTLEDLTLYVAERADKERESMVRQLGAPVDGVKTKLEEMENTIAGFQRTMHLVLSEVDADKERSTAIKTLGASVEKMRSAFSRVSGEVTPAAYKSKIEAALQNMTSKINESANQQSRLERLARTLGRDHNSSTAMKRLQMELEQARSAAVLAVLPRNNEVLIGSRCLSCNRPLGGFNPPPLSKQLDEWYASAGGKGGSRDRVIEPTTAVGGGGIGRGMGGGSGSGGSGGDGSSTSSIGSSKPPGQTQPVITPGKIMPPGSEVVGSVPGTAPRKGPQGPLLFERTGGVDGASLGPGLKGRVLRGGGAPVPAEGNVSISKYPRLVPLTAPKSAPGTDKLYATTSGGTMTAAAPNRRRSSSVAASSEWTRSLLDSVPDRGRESN